MRKLVIRNGQVALDDRILDKSEIPQSLHISGLEASLSFTGDAHPIIEMNGLYYQLEDHRVKELPKLPAGKGAISIFILDGNDDLDATSLFSPYQNTSLARPQKSYYYAVAPVNMAMQQYAFSLKQKAAQLRQFNSGSEEWSEQELSKMTGMVAQETEQAAIAAEELPRLQVRDYLLSLRQNDEDLFQRLVRESRMEEETNRLASEISDMAPGKQKEQANEKLRVMLNKIFELKQQNRRREILRLEARLQDMQLNLEQREELRNEIIENRLSQLVKKFEKTPK